MSRKFLVKNISPLFALPFAGTSDIVRRSERKRRKAQFVKRNMHNLGILALLPGSLRKDGKSKKAQAQYVQKHIKEHKNTEQAYQHSVAMQQLKDQKRQPTFAHAQRANDNSLLLLSLEQTQNMFAGFTSSLGSRRAGSTEKATGEYKSQLRERRKIRFLYGGLSRRHLQEAVNKAKLLPGSPNENLLSLLESRVDVALQRCGFFLSIQTARQSVLSKKIEINSKIVLSPAYLLKPGDILSVKNSVFKQTKTTACELVPVIKSLEPSFPSWYQQVSPFAFRLFLEIQSALLYAIEMEKEKDLSLAGKQSKSRNKSYPCHADQHYKEKNATSTSQAKPTSASLLYGQAKQLKLKKGLDFVNTPKAETALNDEAYTFSAASHKGLSLQLTETSKLRSHSLQQIIKDCAFDSVNENKSKYFDLLCPHGAVAQPHQQQKPKDTCFSIHSKVQSTLDVPKGESASKADASFPHEAQRCDLRKKALEAATYQNVFTRAQQNNNMPQLVSVTIPNLTCAFRRNTRAQPCCATAHARFFNTFCFWLHIRKNLLTLERYSKTLNKKRSWGLHQRDDLLLSNKYVSYEQQQDFIYSSKAALQMTTQQSPQPQAPLKKMSKCLHLEVSYQSMCAIYLFPTQQTSLPLLLDLDLITRSL